MDDVVKSVYKHKFLFAVFASVLMVSAFACSTVVEQNTYVEAGPVGMVVAALLTVVIAAAILPTLANTSHGVILNDGNDSVRNDLDTTSETLIELWPLFVIIGVSIALLAFAI